MAVHPRLRGELFKMDALARQISGSSPLARGTRYAVNTDVDFSRFIPACAGNSVFDRSHDYKTTVHPRLRGELPLLISNYRVNHGSSPLARGTHLKWLQHYTNRLTAKLLKNISKQE